MAPSKKKSNLRQRRSKSPLLSRGDYHENGDGEAPRLSPTVKSSSWKNYDDDDDDDDDNDKAIRTHSLTTKLMFGCLALVILIACGLGVYWLALYTRFYNPDAKTCPIAKFKYPWCAHTIMHVEQRIPAPLTPEEWLQLRKHYQVAMAQGGAPPSNNKSSLADGWDELGSVGFPIKDQLEIRTSPGKGRGLYTTQPIAKGTKIWDNRYRAVFPNECTAKIFFAELSNQMACDAMFWGYTNNFYGNDVGVQYMLDLDGHGYINHEGHHPNAAHHFEEEMETQNYAVPRILRPWGGSLTQSDPARNLARTKPGAYGLYAQRDIEAGEEIVYNYSEIYQRGYFDWYTFLICHSLPIQDWNTI